MKLINHMTSLAHPLSYVRTFFPSPPQKTCPKGALGRPDSSMDFFKSVFSNDPQASDQAPQEAQRNPSSQNPIPNSPARSNAGPWSFGGLIKTLATSSESVIENYRRDLEEFRSGLKKETTAIRGVIKDLPVSLEAGASAAQESIESVGQAIDDFGASVWRGTAEIILQGKDGLVSSDHESDYSSDAQNAGCYGANSKRLSRFEAQVLAIQADMNTYCEDPGDLDDFRQWNSGLVLEERSEEIEKLCGENGLLEGVYAQLVPDTVDHETFWSRYFYSVHKLRQAEDVRADLAKRTISREDEEDLSWDVDDDSDEREDNVAPPKQNESSEDVELNEKEFIAGSELVIEKKPHVNELDAESSVSRLRNMGFVLEPVGDAIQLNGDEEVDKSDMKMDQCVLNNDEKVEKSGEKMQGKADQGESSRNSNFLVVSSQPSAQVEDDFGWDEIGDLDNNDEKKVSVSETQSIADLRKRLSAADADEDLSWDIEDDDEPTKP